MVEYKRILEENIDAEYKAFHEKLVPGVQNIRGVRSPIIKQLAKEIVKQDYDCFLEERSFDNYEEKMLYGIVIGNLKLPFEQVAKHIIEFVPIIDNWAVCDSFCASLKITVKNKQEMWRLLERYFNSKEEYEIRFAVVMLMDYYIEPVYIDEVLAVLAKIKHNGYYVKMAIAWAISSAFVKEKEKTLKFICSDNLESWTRNKSLQKIRESYRVSKEDKLSLNQMKNNMDW
ncbi:MAG: DNA alkylation repair protein [Peptostreptococcaceae bacterium]|nr:DNA alkylation repair protein [Peptostreptococcaceae bacterium]